MKTTKLGALCLCSLAVSCNNEKTQQPNILLIMCDQLNASVLGCYGGEVKTPNLDRLASGSAVFTNMMCATPISSPSRATLVTGMYPHTHGIKHNCNIIDYPEIGSPATEEGITNEDITTDRILNENGWDTHHYGKWHLTQEWPSYFPDMYGEHHQYLDEMKDIFKEVEEGKDRMIDWYGWKIPVERAPYIKEHEKEILQRWADAGLTTYTQFAINLGKSKLKIEDDFDWRVAEKTIASISQKRDRPFMITCSFNQPHDPNVVSNPFYDMVDPSKIRLPESIDNIDPYYNNSFSRIAITAGEEYMREFLRIYYANVMKVDFLVGKILDELEKTGQLENTVVIFTADHGDMATEHGMMWKSTEAFYQAIVRIPFIIRWPEKFGKMTYDMAIDNTSIMPTLLDIAGLETPEQCQGVSLYPLLTGEKQQEDYDGFAFCERRGGNKEHMRKLHPQWKKKCSFMIASKDYKYCIDNGQYEIFYDLTKDKNETTNQIDNPVYTGIIQMMKAELEDWKERTE